MTPRPQKVYDEKRSWNYVLWLLGRKAYTKAELIKRLKKKEASQTTIDKVMAKLEDYRYIDDEHYAKSFVRSRKQKKGIIALKQELYAKGVPEIISNQVLAEIAQDDQVEAARALVEKQRWRWKGEAREQRAKAYAYLARRGFPSDIVAQALEDIVFAATQEEV